MLSMRQIPALLVCVVLAAAAFAQEEKPPTLKVGDDAPAMSIEKWVKGGQVDKLEKGKVYVVEFWATWCGPCKTSIPHLTEVAKKFEGKATVIGVSVWERFQTNEELIAKVEAFVKDMGDKMNYVVAIDGINGSMAKDWMQAAGRRGIPSAFIVNKDGKIAWMGHPMAKMDEALAQIVEGKWDVEAEAQRQAKAAADEKQEQELLKGLQAVVGTNDSSAILQEIDKAVAAMPQLEARLATLKFDHLLKTDEPAAFAYLKGLMAKDTIKPNPGAAYQIGNILVRAPQLKSPDWATVIAALEQANTETGNKESVLFGVLAEILFKAGQPEKAAESQQKAIDLAQAAGRPQATLDSMKKRLEAFKATPVAN